MRSANDATLEEWFLTHVQDAVIPIETLTTILRLFQSRGHLEKAEACADLLHDTLAQQRSEEALLSLWEMRAAWHTEDPAFTAVCAGKLGAFFQDHSRMERLIHQAGFDRNLSAIECLRRFRILRGLQPGVLCYEKTWGLGTVVDIAEFDQQVRIDFDKKKGHRMSLTYAAETLQLLHDDHLLARHHRDPQGVAAWVRKDPAGVVKSALQSFGPLSVPSLQELLVDRLLPGTEWKRFWEAARKQLKKDPLVEFPARRNESIRLLNREKAYDEEWLNALTAERDMDLILEQIETWKIAVAPAASDTMPQAIQDRLNFVIHGADLPSQKRSAQAGKTHAASRAHALLLADELGVLDGIQNAAGHISALFSPEIIIESVHHLPAAMIERLLGFMSRRDAGQTAERLCQILPHLALPPFNETVNFLRKNGAEPRLIDTLRALMTAGNATPEMIYWLCRHDDFVQTHGIGAMGQLVIEALNVVEASHISGERLKAKHQLRFLLEKSNWLPTALSAMADLERRHFISRLKQSPAWSAAERHALIHRLAQAFPELKSFLAEELPATASVVTRHFTSLRSYNARQAQLHKLITEDIPQNSRDIATARGYGDLRENFEYKSARETQGILMRRRLELETMLNKVTSTDFEEFPTTTAGPGTHVAVTHANGHQERYVILGEWDSDESLGIISSQSKMAQSMGGHKAGDQILIPTEDGPVRATLTEVSGLLAAIKTWIRGN